MGQFSIWPMGFGPIFDLAHFNFGPLVKRPYLFLHPWPEHHSGFCPLILVISCFFNWYQGSVSESGNHNNSRETATRLARGKHGFREYGRLQTIPQVPPETQLYCIPFRRYPFLRGFWSFLISPEKSVIYSCIFLFPRLGSCDWGSWVWVLFRFQPSNWF